MTTGGVGGPGPGPSGDVLHDLKAGRIQDPKARLRAATSLLESSFYQQLFEAMRKTVPEGGALPTSAGQDMFGSMLNQHVADAAALSSDRGLGQALYRMFVDAVAPDVSGAEADGGVAASTAGESDGGGVSNDAARTDRPGAAG